MLQGEGEADPAPSQSKVVTPPWAKHPTNLIFSSHNTEKVIYFLLLERKRRRPAYEDDTDSILRMRVSETSDPPKKRIDTCRVNGQSGLQFGQISEGSPLTPRRSHYKRHHPRRSPSTGSTHSSLGVHSPTRSSGASSPILFNSTTAPLNTHCKWPNVKNLREQFFPQLGCPRRCSAPPRTTPTAPRPTCPTPT
jgi:hypothetical protein